MVSKAASKTKEAGRAAGRKPRAKVAKAKSPPAVVETPLRPPTTGRFAVPADADLSYISPELRYLAKPLALFQLEPVNVKDHNEIDLPAHQQSLREFGIRRVLIARGENLMLEAGNGAAQAIQRNGWLYAPIALEDDTEQQAKAFGLADNAVGALAAWNEENLKKVRADIEGLDLEIDLDGLAESFLKELGAELESAAESAEEADESESGEAETDAGQQSQYLHRLQVVCQNEPEMLKLAGELESRGLTVKVMPTKVL